MIAHADQETVRVAWELPPEGPGWFRAFKPIDVPLGVALDGERRGVCERIRITAP
jgi:hypothetical protein